MQQKLLSIVVHLSAHLSIFFFSTKENNWIVSVHIIVTHTLVDLYMNFDWAILTIF